MEEIAPAQVPLGSEPVARSLPNFSSAPSSAAGSPYLGSSTPILRDSPEPVDLDLDALMFGLMADKTSTSSIARRTDSMPSLSNSAQSTPDSTTDLSLPPLPPLMGLSSINLSLKTPTPAQPLLCKATTRFDATERTDSSFSYFDIPVLVTHTANGQQNDEPSTILQDVATSHKPQSQTMSQPSQPHLSVKTSSLRPPTPMLFRSDFDWSSLSNTISPKSATKSFFLASPLTTTGPILSLPAFGQTTSLLSPMNIPMTPSHLHPDWSKFASSTTLSPQTDGMPTSLTHDAAGAPSNNFYAMIGSVF
ncbi:hypothetical protein OIO90_002112 [Microbotryomycetes sp. JL221]|nr:hypothetical protein OIO90_002112 [Microbotryomycetes sp. JL221]